MVSFPPWINQNRNSEIANVRALIDLFPITRIRPVTDANHRIFICLRSLVYRLSVDVIGVRVVRRKT
nr:MAG TPA: hypothetical protein [Caudoviricetes sp.]